jgi:hypothetical protein
MSKQIRVVSMILSLLVLAAAAIDSTPVVFEGYVLTFQEDTLLGVSGQKVYLEAEYRIAPNEEWDYKYTAATDDKGYFHIEVEHWNAPHSYELRVEGEQSMPWVPTPGRLKEARIRYLDVESLLEDGRIPYNLFVLESGHTVTHTTPLAPTPQGPVTFDGYVLRKDGDHFVGVSGQEVHLVIEYLFSESSRFSEEYETWTDADGRFQFQEVEWYLDGPGEYWLELVDVRDDHTPSMAWAPTVVAESPTVIAYDAESLIVRTSDEFVPYNLFFLEREEEFTRDQVYLPLILAEKGR